MSYTGERYIYTMPDYGDILTVKEYRELVAAGTLIDYDGNGYPVRDGLLDRTVYIKPSTDNIPEDATHIVWFNR